MDYLQPIVQHPLFGITSFIIGLLGVVLAYVFYRLGRKSKNPCWDLTSYNLISGFSKKLPQLDIKYSGQPVENLTISRLRFWNAGLETIDVSDIADAAPLKIVPNNAITLLDVKLLVENSESSRFLISTAPDQSAAFLNFDFVDKGEGCVIQVIHTGKTSEDIRFSGTIKGAGNIENREVKTVNSRADFLKALVVSIFSIFACLGAALILLSKSPHWFGWVMASFYVFLAVVMGKSIRNNWNKVIIPKGLGT